MPLFIVDKTREHSRNFTCLTDISTKSVQSFDEPQKDLTSELAVQLTHFQKERKTFGKIHI